MRTLDETIESIIEDVHALMADRIEGLRRDEVDTAAPDCQRLLAIFQDVTALHRRYAGIRLAKAVARLNAAEANCARLVKTLDALDAETTPTK